MRIFAFLLTIAAFGQDYKVASFREEVERDKKALEAIRAAVPVRETALKALKEAISANDVESAQKAFWPAWDAENDVSSAKRQVEMGVEYLPNSLKTAPLEIGDPEKIAAGEILSQLKPFTKVPVRVLSQELAFTAFDFALKGGDKSANTFKKAVKNRATAAKRLKKARQDEKKGYINEFLLAHKSVVEAAKTQFAYAGLIGTISSYLDAEEIFLSKHNKNANKTLGKIKKNGNNRFIPKKELDVYGEAAGADARTRLVISGG